MNVYLTSGRTAGRGLGRRAGHSGVARVLAVVALCAMTAVQAEASWRASADSLYAAADERYLARDYDAAADLFDRAIDTVAANATPLPGSYFAQLTGRSRYLLARSHERMENWDTAIHHYRLALTELGEIDDLIRLRLAACHGEAGDHASAVNQLRVVIDDGVAGQFDLEAMHDLASRYDESGDHDMALQWYTLYLGEADSYGERALAHHRMGGAYERRGDKEAAARSYAKAVNDYPRSRHSYDALQSGRNISRSFTDRYHQGLVLYNRKKYAQSVEFFTWYVRHDRERDFAHEANYFLARGHQRLGNFRTAARRYEDAIEFGPDSEYFDLAWSKLAYCRRASGKLEESLDTYERYVSSYPNREAAPSLLWEKARLLEEKQRWEEAEAEFRRIAGVYPESDRANDAVFRAGLCLYKRGRYYDASVLFAGAYLNASGEDASRALFWSGKCRERLAGTDAAVAAYADAARAAPDSYYGARSRARLRELGAESPSVWTSEGRGSVASRGENGARSRRLNGPRAAAWGAETLEFASWLAEWYDEVYLPAGRAALRKNIHEHSSFRRTDVLLALHMRDEALAELSDVAADLGSDPRALDVMVEYCERTGLHKRAILLAERILGLSPARGLHEAPVYLLKRICPTHFRDIVDRECSARGIDPNVKLSLIRQESLFEPRAVSWVGARGLSQIMPSTGRWVARRLGVRGYNTSQLFDPATNVRFGAEYLSVQLEEFDGDVVRALAAYNGGPEASERWWGYGGGLDTDVFVEDIGYSQTAEYVRRIFLYSEFYRDLYGDRVLTP